jgi:flagellar biosynthesis protein
MSSKPSYKTAIGLQYNVGAQGAPAVSAKGEYLAADEVVKIARRFGVPVVERPALARSLAPLELDQEIPEDLFEAVAAVLQEIDKISG